MGLDMYLERHIYIGANYEHNNITGQINLKRNGERIPINIKRVGTIIEEAAYWRKCNMIHKWFVDNVQDGNDDCGKYYVSVAKLKELYDTCKKVLDARDSDTKNGYEVAERLLPTQAGFFFGDTEYSNYYYDDIKYTIDQLKPFIREEEDYRISYYYSSSW